MCQGNACSSPEHVEGSFVPEFTRVRIKRARMQKTQTFFKCENSKQVVGQASRTYFLR